MYFGAKEKNAVTLPHSAQRKHAFLGKIKEISKTKKLPSRKKLALETCSSPRRAIHSHYLVCSKNSLLIVGKGTILYKELKFIFRSDRSDCTCVYS